MGGIWGTIPDWVNVLIALFSYISFIVIQRNQLIPNSKKYKKPLQPNLPIKRTEVTGDEIPKGETTKDEEIHETSDDNPVGRARIYSFALIGIAISIAMHPILSNIFISLDPTIASPVLLLASDISVCVLIGLLFGIIKEFGHSPSRILVGIVERIIVSCVYGFLMEFFFIIISTKSEIAAPDKSAPGYNFFLIILSLSNSQLVHTILIGVTSTIGIADPYTIFDKEAWKWNWKWK